MSKNFRARDAEEDDSTAEVSDDDCQNNCPLQPHFKAEEDSVQLARDKYVQLLIEARETDPGCWPPGLEGAAHLLERACAIEEACALKHGYFEPGRLSKKIGDEYLQIHLDLDELQSSIEDAANSVGDSSEDSVQDDEELPPILMPRGTWAETNAHLRPDNFA